MNGLRLTGISIRMASMPMPFQDSATRYGGIGDLTPGIGTTDGTGISDGDTVDSDSVSDGEPPGITTDGMDTTITTARYGAEEDTT